MIEIIGLSKKIGQQRVLENINLSAEEGSLLAVLGPSGSGKTSLLRLIAGFDRPSAGEIRLSGRTVSSPTILVPPAQRRLSMIFQSLALWPHLTVEGNIKFVMNGRTRGDRKRSREEIDRLLSLMHLERYRTRYPGELSGGERQRLAIARALASKPEYLLMDEPFTNLDDLLKEELLQMTLSLKKNSRLTIVYVTHNIDEALFLADQMAVLRGGRVAKRWLKEEIRELTREKVLRQGLKENPDDSKEV